MKRSEEFIKVPTNYGVHNTKILVNKSGVVVHKGVVDIGKHGDSKPRETNSYKVSHLASGKGLTLGDGFDKKKTAVEYAEKLASLTDWNKKTIPDTVIKKALELHNSLRK